MKWLKRESAHLSSPAVLRALKLSSFSLFLARHVLFLNFVCCGEKQN